MNVDTETLTLEAIESETEAQELMNVITTSAGVNEISKLESEIAKKDLEYKGLQSKCYLLSSSFEQLTNKIEIVERNFKESVETIETQKSDIQKYKDSVAKYEIEKAILIHC